MSSSGNHPLTSRTQDNIIDIDDIYTTYRLKRVRGIRTKRKQRIVSVQVKILAIASDGEPMRIFGNSELLPTLRTDLRSEVQSSNNPEESIFSVLDKEIFIALVKQAITEAYGRVKKYCKETKRTCEIESIRRIDFTETYPLHVKGHLAKLAVRA